MLFLSKPTEAKNDPLRTMKMRPWVMLLCCVLSILLVPTTSWADDDDDDEDIAKKPFIEYSGYFRFRGDIFQNFALGVAPREGVDTTSTQQRPYGSFPFYHPTRAYPFLNGSLPGLPTDGTVPNIHTFSNMRFRLSTTFNVSEKIQINTLVDFLDNVIFGSTPRGDIGMLQDPFIPLLGFSDTQLPPQSGQNGTFDAIRVRQVFAHVTLPLGILRIGRMPSQWGLGILANNGYKINSDYGDSNDRVLFATKPLAPFIDRVKDDKTRASLNKYFNPALIVAIDIVSSGPYSTLPATQLGQPFDLDPTDDARQYIFALAQITRGKELERRIENGETIVNYGLYFVLRQQQYSAECLVEDTCKQPDGAKPAVNGRGRHPATIQLAERNANAYIPDIWFRLLWKDKMRLEFEATMIFGEIGNGPNKEAFDLFQYGAALEFEYRFLDGDLRLEFDAGIASGDNDFFSRWVFQPDTDNNNGRGQINNFRFDPDYQVDMILFRELYGTVSNAFYTKLQLTYNIFNDPWDINEEGGLGIRLSGMYSQALNIAATYGKAAPLGVELNAMLHWASRDGYSFIFAYGLLIPLDGLDRATFADAGNQTGRNVEAEAGLAHRFQFRIAIRFGNKFGF